jgi:hypothetical protein
MMINGIIALPAKITSLTEVLPSYEQNILRYDLVQANYVDEFNVVLPAPAQFLKGLSMVQVGILSNDPLDVGKEVYLKFVGCNEGQTDPLILVEKWVKVGEYINFGSSTCIQNSIKINDPYWKMEVGYSGVSPSPTPAMGTLFTFRINQTRDGIYENDKTVLKPKIQAPWPVATSTNKLSKDKPIHSNKTV